MSPPVAGLKSMTGFGRASADLAVARVTVEIRTVNHRGLDVKLRARDLDGAAENALQTYLRSVLRRGSVSVSVDVQSGHLASFDETWFANLARAVERLRQTLGLSEPVSLSTVAQFAALIHGGAEAGSAAKATVGWPDLEPIVVAAMTQLEASRQREGQSLQVDLLARRQRLADIAHNLQKLTEGAAQRAGERIRSRVAAMLGEIGLDPQRLAQEIAFLADRSDVTEELVRLHTHLQHFAQLADGTAPDAPEGVGRRMDFWLQEIGREFNTLASKSQDAQISALVVQAKAELEKIREQAQNIE